MSNKKSPQKDMQIIPNLASKQLAIHEMSGNVCHCKAGGTEPPATNKNGLTTEAKMDNFFTKEHCDRCGAKLTARIQSMFNSDTICIKCKAEEREHPDYRKAVDADVEAIRQGNMNFKGIGWTPTSKR